MCRAKIENSFGAVSCLYQASSARSRCAALALTCSEGMKMTKKVSPPAAPVTPMTARDAARIQSATAKAGDGTVPKRSFAARATRAAAKAGKR
jgi:hypothetical protein